MMAIYPQVRARAFVLSDVCIDNACLASRFTAVKRLQVEETLTDEQLQEKARLAFQAIGTATGQVHHVMRIHVCGDPLFVS